jgi:acetyl coenzyme A synthetase (ADP forming)-like protein
MHRGNCSMQTALSHPCDIVLRDGSTLEIRPATLADAPAVLALFQRLSPESVYKRFGAAHRPTSTDAARVCGTNGNDAALVAERAGSIVAAVQYCRDPQKPDRAEVAFTVADEFQGLGIGTRMLERLAAIARERGLAWFDAYVLGTNRQMLRLFADSGFTLAQDSERGAVQVMLSLAETAAHEERAAARAAISAAASLRPFFEPRTVAVVGAGRTRGGIGAEIFHNLIAGGFRGNLYPVNSAAVTVEEHPAYPSVTAIAEAVDLAIIAVPAACVDDVVDDCIRKGVRGIVVISAGFSEAGPEGRARERALVDKVRSAGIRMVGPNCMGVVNTNACVRLNATFAPVSPVAGRVAFSSQSGALGLAILDYARSLNLGVSTFVSVGNKADVSSNDLIQYWSEDPGTDVILLYLESFGNPRKFTQIARRVARRKPIVAVKAGRSNAGARAAASHTGALAASDTIVDALFGQAGVIRTDTLEELFEVAMLLAHQPLPAGGRVAVLTNAGGPGILAADACEAAGLTLPVLTESTAASLRAFLPAAASVANPVDVLATASADDYRRAIPLLLADPQVDSLIVIFTPPLVTHADDVARAIVETTRRAHKPVLATFLTAKGAPASLSPVPCYTFPESAARALARAARYARWRATPPGACRLFADIRPSEARAIVARALSAGGGWLNASEAAALLDAVGITTTWTVAAAHIEAAVEAARQIGFPVVLKAAGPTLLHKTEARAVAIGLANEDAVRRAYADFVARLGDALTGVVVQPMISNGTEMFVGATLDPTFGHVVMCGGGGTRLELLKDVACGLHPLTDATAQEMLDSLRSIQLLRGFRGAPHGDEAALRELMLRLSALLDVCPEVVEIDLNPVIVLSSGIQAVDVRVRVSREEPRPPSRRVEY